MTQAPDGMCSSCGTPEFSTSRFCGTCGQPMSSPATHQKEGLQAAAGTPVLAWVAGAGFAGAGLLFIGMVGFFMGDLDSFAGGSASTTSEVKATTANPGISRENDPLKNATEVDKTSSFSYVNKPPSCSEFARLSDVVKDIGAEIDKELRTVDRVSLAEEEALGREVLKAVRTELGGTLRTSGTMAEYLTAVAQPLVDQASRKNIKYRFYYAPDATMENALALPGGHIIVTAPLIKNWVKNEAQLAIVLGHEIGHIEMKHPLAVIQYSRSLGLPEDEAISMTALQLIQTPYSSRQEEDADRYGVHLAHTAQYSAFQGVALWNSKVRSVPPSKKSGGLMDVVFGEADNMLGSHPPAAKRACKMKQFVAKEHAKVAKERTYVGTTNYSRKVPKEKQVW